MNKQTNKQNKNRLLPDQTNFWCQVYNTVPDVATVPIHPINNQYNPTNNERFTPPSFPQYAPGDGAHYPIEQGYPDNTLGGSSENDRTRWLN